MMTTDEIYTAIEQACYYCDCPELSGKVRVRFSRRITRSAGWADYRKIEIRLGLNYWNKATEADRINTVYHEACHLIARKKYGAVKPHGSTWQALMRRCGQNPTRCHNVNTGPRKLRGRRRAIDCSNCGKRSMMGPVQFKRFVTGRTGYRCRACGSPFTRNDAVRTLSV